ncbi:MAG: hypothetical protein A2519_11605 [Candidatus Raymondbacteria bacterium RIFOXYD12_FULL_49_13]|uniref:HTH araC/xylS-type domain-containing protein n=1 Tax=Candidatus Raymondbacteria bacterium RIFOXYD12_FULL_49_13 TaxID=1817890 RepID=A0A1F7FJV0_UNCRA|nr:MAG: hypothetical protein A2519_11605 [Candidatus Raymondbacteria bacterium RIFOXYD12_FULL_49_13]
MDQNSTRIELTPSNSISQWSDSGGVGLLDCDNPARRDYFTYGKRIGNTLIGVSGVDFFHPEGVTVQTNGKLQWNTYPALKSGQNDSSSSIHEGFGMRFFRGCSFIEKMISGTDHISLRFYITIASFFDSTASPTKLVGIHALIPADIVTMALRYKNGKEAQLEFRVQPYGILHTMDIPFGRTTCVEYDFNHIRQTHRCAVSIWLDNKAVFQKDLQVDPEVKVAPVFGFQFHYSNDPLHYLYADYTIDDLVCAHERFGPRSSPPVIRIIPREGGIFDVVPEDTVSIEDIEFRFSHDGTTRFPYFFQHTGPGAGFCYHFKYVYFPLEKLTLQSHVKRKGEDWSVWNSVYVSLPDTVMLKNKDWSVWSVALKHPEASVQKPRPVVDSIVVTRVGETKAVDTLVRNAWYDIYFYASDQQGFDNLFYNYIMLNHSSATECNPLNQGGNYDPRENYFISLSNDEKLVYIKDTPGYSHAIPVSPTCTSYVNGIQGSYVVDQLKRFWKTNFRLLAQAEPGIWMLEGVIFNRQEIPSISLRKKMTVVETLTVRPNKFSRMFYYISIPIVLVVIFLLLFLFLFLFRKKNELAVKINDKGLDFRVKFALEYIANNYTKDLTLNDIGIAVNANAAWLSTTYKKQTGIAIFNHINKLRCEKAIEYLLNNQMNISQISYKLGFNDPAYFKQVFKKFTGKAPSHFRKYKLEGDL